MTQATKNSLQIDDLARTSVRIATDHEIEEINQKQGWSGARRLEPTRQAIQRIRTQKSASEDRFQSWLAHPDERVQMAMVEERKNETAPWGGPQEETRRRGQELGGQVAGQLLQEDVCWNPVIDALAANGLYPYHRTGGVGKKTLKRHDQQLEPLQHFIEKVQDFSTLQPLLVFQSPTLRDGLASHPDLPPQALEELKDTPTAMAKIGRQEHLHDTTREQTFQWVINVLDHLREQAEEQNPRDWPQKQRRKRRRQTEWTWKVLKRLIRKHDLNLTSRHQDQLLDTIPPGPDHGHTGARGLFEGGMWIKHLKRKPLVGQLDQEHLHQLYEQMRDIPEAGALLAQPKLGARTWHQTLDWLPRRDGWHGEKVQKGLARHPRALLESKRVRDFLMTAAQKPAVLEPMLEQLKGEEPSLYRKVLDRLFAIAEQGDDHWQRNRAAKVLRQHVQTPDELFRLYQALKDRPPQKFQKIVEGLLRHEQADPRLACRILDDTRSSTVRQAVLKIPWARQADAIRKKVSQTRDKKLLELLLKEASGEELRTYFRRLVTKEPERAGEIFENMSPEEIQQLGADELQKLLAAPNRQIRMAALMAASNIEKSEPDRSEKPRKR